MSIRADREFWLAVRQALLALVDAIERELSIKPTTAVIRRSYRTGSLVHAEDILPSAHLITESSNLEQVRVNPCNED